jgi:large conductance mechanosensitive channel
MRERGATVLKGFKEFLLRGNLLDLAVAVVIGVAFTALVNALVKDLITPFVAAIAGKQDFGALHVTVNGSVIAYGDFINALLSFVLIAAVIFFLVVQPVNRIMDRLGLTPKEEPMRECTDCLSKVPAAATRCAYCTSALTPTGSGSDA